MRRGNKWFCYTLVFFPFSALAIDSFEITWCLTRKLFPVNLSNQRGKRYVTRFISTTSWNLLQGLHFFAGLLKEVKTGPSRNELILFPLNLNWWDSWKTKLIVFDRHQSLRVFKYFYVPFRDRPFDCWWGYDGWFQKKQMSCRVISRGKIIAREIPAKKIPIMKKISFKAYKAGKKSYIVVCQEKILSPEVGEIFFYPSQITHTPPPPPLLPSKVKWSAP